MKINVDKDVRIVTVVKENKEREIFLSSFFLPELGWNAHLVTRSEHTLSQL
jgi:hypothetical protein